MRRTTISGCAPTWSAPHDGRRTDLVSATQQPRVVPAPSATPVIGNTPPWAPERG